MAFHNVTIDKNNKRCYNTRSGEISLALTHPYQLEVSMNINKFFALAALVIAISSANAQSIAQTFQNKNGETILVESHNNSGKAFPAVIVAIEKAGYRRSTSGYIEPGAKTDTWCKVDVYRKREIFGVCYTPHQEHGLVIHDRVVIFNGDYSEVPLMVAEIRDKHRRASTLLGIK